MIFCRKNKSRTKFSTFLGIPPSKLVWTKNNMTVSSSDPVDSDEYTQSFIWIENVMRKDLGHIYTCSASNNNIVPPVKKSVILDIIRKSKTLLVNGFIQWKFINLSTVPCSHERCVAIGSVSVKSF